MKWSEAPGDLPLRDLCKQMVDADALYCEVLIPTEGNDLPITIHVALCPTELSEGLRMRIQEYLGTYIGR